jgi:hypothetical protein
MSFVIYHKESTRIYTYTRHNPWKRVESYATLAAVKAAFTRLVKKGEINESEWSIADSELFHMLIEKHVTKTNLMSGEEFQERVNTPHYCSPSSESYWSM